MPTMDIIGYLWSKKQDLDLYSVPDVLQLASDLARNGLECIDITDIEVFGVSIGQPSIAWVRLDEEEWSWMVENALASAAAEHAVHMLQGGDSE